jgi:hypothetical protein
MTAAVPEQGCSEESDSKQEAIGPVKNQSYEKASAEYLRFEKDFKSKRVLPKSFVAGKERVLHGGGNRTIVVGQVKEKGENLQSGKKLGDYIGEDGIFDLVDFFTDHELFFPKLCHLAIKRAAARTVEVECERFF